MNADKNNNFSKFELLLLRETILGFIHLSLDRMVEFRRTGNLKGVAEIKEIISQHHKFLTKLNEQIDPKLKD